jgi:hypothetical protein
MKKTFIFLLTMVVICSCLAQEDYREPSPASQAYHTSRYYETRPPYGLEKVRQLIKTRTVKREDPNGEDAGTDSLPERLYRMFSLREKFTYNMIYYESYSQGCNYVGAIVDEEKQIFGNIPDRIGDEYWGGRQINFFNDNKDSVVALMAESIARARRIGLNYKHVIIDINATSMIPLLIHTYDLEKKDHDILTLLLLLMKNNNYKPFYASASYKKLYTGEHPYFGGSITYNSANEALVIQRATDFYNGLAK